MSKDFSRFVISFQYLRQFSMFCDSFQCFFKCFSRLKICAVIVLLASVSAEVLKLTNSSQIERGGRGAQ